MINRFEFKDMVMKYGEPIATSPDGLNYVFKKKRKAVFSVLHLDEREFTLIKTIQISKEVEDYLNKCDPEDKRYLLREQEWLNNKKNLEFEISITNLFDVVVRINKKTGDDCNDMQMASNQMLGQIRQNNDKKSC